MTNIETDSKKQRPIFTRIGLILLRIVLIVAILLFILNAIKPYAFHGAVLQSPEPAHNFTLQAHYGQPLTLSDYRGKIVLLYFGYATCPDVCPATLAELKEARELLGTRADDVQVMMVTVDPERDTAEDLAEYLGHFDSSFIGLIGTPDEIAQIATYYGVYYKQQEDDSALGYSVDHTATVMLIDPDGYIRLIFPYETEAEAIAEDISYVLDH